MKKKLFAAALATFLIFQSIASTYAMEITVGVEELPPITIGIGVTTTNPTLLSDIFPDPGFAKLVYEKVLDYPSGIFRHDYVLSETNLETIKNFGKNNAMQKLEVDYRDDYDIQNIIGIGYFENLGVLSIEQPQYGKQSNYQGGISDIPGEIQACTNLTSINLAYGDITYIPPYIMGMTNIIHFGVPYNEVSEGVHNILLRNPGKPLSVSLQNNEIDDEDIPEYPMSDDIYHLDLLGNNLTQIPSNIMTPNLKYLDLSHNHIEQITNLTQTNFPNLQLLNISNNHIVDFTPALSFDPALRASINARGQLIQSQPVTVPYEAEKIDLALADYPFIFRQNQGDSLCDYYTIRYNENNIAIPSDNYRPNDIKVFTSNLSEMQMSFSAHATEIGVKIPDYTYPPDPDTIYLETGAIERTQHEGDSNYIANADITYIIPVVFEGPPKTYVTMTYDANGGTGDQHVVEVEQFTIHTILTPEATGISRPGYLFKGWNNRPEGTGTTGPGPSTHPGPSGSSSQGSGSSGGKGKGNSRTTVTSGTPGPKAGVPFSRTKNR